jgi:hypothetical protein
MNAYDEVPLMKPLLLKMDNNVVSRAEVKG